MSPILGVYASQISGKLTASGSYYSIASYVVPDSSTTSVTFSSIPSTYKMIQIRYSGSSSDDYMYFRTNIGVGTYRQTLYGTRDGGYNYAGTADASYGLELHLGGIGNTWQAMGMINILDYSSTNKTKTGKSLFGLDYGTGGAINQNSFYINSTTAINSVTIQSNSAAPYYLLQGMTIALYGVN